jgi:hypothetical protein
MLDKRYTVFEAVNETLHEIFVGMTASGLNTMQRSVKAPEIKHWLETHAVTYRSVEFSLAASHAADFVLTHAKTLVKPGWTVITARR